MMSKTKLPGFSKISPHLAGVLLALFVTLLWSTSWVIIKVGLAELPALPFAGLRYTLAFLCLLPLNLVRRPSPTWKKLSRKEWLLLGALGLVYYTITQGTQFLALAYIPAMSASLILNFTTAAVALLGIFLLAERPTPLQWLGIAVNLAGILIYFYPADLPPGQVLGVAVAALGTLANAGSSILGRYVNRLGTISPLQVTTVSMGIGSVLLLGTGIAVQGLPPLSLGSWLAVIWLAVVNTALAFSLWNRTLRVLSAVESSIINSTMLIQIAFLAWIFLGESLSWQGGIGMALAAAGVVIVQVKKQGGGE